MIAVHNKGKLHAILLVYEGRSVLFIIFTVGFDHVRTIRQGKVTFHLYQRLLHDMTLYLAYIQAKACL